MRHYTISPNLSSLSRCHLGNEKARIPRVISLINNNGLPKTLLHSLLNTSTECWCGAYKTESDFKKLYGLNKEIFHKLVKLEEESKSGYTFLYKNGQKIPLKDLEKGILKTNDGE